MRLLPALLLAAAAPQMTDDRYAVDEAMAPPAGARPTWADEFDGARLDGSRWTYDTELNRRGWANNERQYYAADRRENVRLERGRLVIEARREPLRDRPDWGGQGYSSGRITTRGRRSWTYGFFEVRARLPCGRGTWPAAWMLPDRGGWPAGGEIDVMEHVGWDPGMVHATLHTALFTHSKGTQRGAQRAVPDACRRFHRYQLDWRPGSITVGIDGRAYMRVRDDQPGGRGAWPFDRPFHLILNLAVGGDWGGARGIDDAALPQRMEVDHVRVWR